MIEPPSGRDITRAVDTGNWRRRRVEYLSGRVVVKLAVPAEARSSIDATRAVLDTSIGEITDSLDGARVLRAVSRSGRIVLEVGKNASVIAIARDLAKRDDVEYAEPDLVDHAAIAPNDTRYGDQWSHGVVGSEAAWDLETGDTNVAIGIIDSGISISGGVPDHPDLSGARIVLGTDFVDGGTPMDTNGHGTHVAGIAAAAGNNAAGIAGMNWVSPIYICRTLDVNGNGGSADFADAVEEMVDWAVLNGISIVINYSAGGGDNLTKQAAAQYASDNGMLLCAATGNDFGGAVLFPAAYSTTIAGVIAVGSTTTTDTVSQFSNVGPEVTVVAPGGEIAGGVVPPGEAILSTFPTYAVTIPGGPNFAGLVGTSMATPLVTGLAALMWSRHPSFTNQKIKDCLTDTAVKLGAGSFANAWGFGRVDAEAALRCGDLVLPPVFSVLRPCVPLSRLVRCDPSRILVACAVSNTIPCPTPFPRLCPTSRVFADCGSEIDACPSAWVECDPVSRFTTCGPVSRFGCPSSIDGCGSALQCEFEPIRPVDPIVQPAVERMAPRAERWADARGRFYYRDEAGTYFMWDPGPGGPAPQP